MKFFLFKFFLRLIRLTYRKIETNLYGGIEQISIYKCKNVKIKKIFPPQDFHMPALKDIEGNIHFAKYDCVIPQVNVYIINKGIFIPGQEEVYDAEGRVLKEITAQKKNPKIGTSKKKLLNYKKLAGKILCLSLSGLEENYSHFHIEYLARLYIFKLSKLRFDYIDFNIKTKFQEQFFNLLNIPKKKLIPSQLTKSAIKADTLIVPSLINNWEYFKMNQGRQHHMKQYIPSWCKKIHEEFRNKTNATYRIYVSRSKANRRQVINEEEVIKLIKKYGFIKYDMEDLDINDQINLFNKAEIIISVHGSQLANMVFCSNSFRLLEIYPQNYLDSCFRILAQVLECDYHYLIGQSPNNSAVDPQKEDVYVDCAKLQKWLNKNVKIKNRIN
jgi:capsular polysaccharide biosynthesis protein